MCLGFCVKEKLVGGSGTSGDWRCSDETRGTDSSPGVQEGGLSRNQQNGLSKPQELPLFITHLHDYFKGHLARIKMEVDSKSTFLGRDGETMIVPYQH